MDHGKVVKPTLFGSMIVDWLYENRIVDVSTVGSSDRPVQQWSKSKTSQLPHLLSMV